MPRQRRQIGPRVKVDISTLRDMAPDDRLRLLTRMAAECGGRSEEEWSESFRENLAKAEATGPARNQTKAG